MHTANLVKISGGQHASEIIKYNLQDKKTQGKWMSQSKELHQSDLVSFEGVPDRSDLTIDQRGSYFDYMIHKTMAWHDHTHNASPLYKNRDQVHTIIQSYDFSANPNLDPITVHATGIELLHAVNRYEQRSYGYSIDGGMVSTHIDRDRIKTREVGSKEIELQPHLHNHIVIPSYNHQSRNITYYLRKRDLYHIQQMNDSICQRHGLNDYYFSKLYRQIHPTSARTIHSKRKTRASYLQTAFTRFSQANGIAWERYPYDFKKARLYRNTYLNRRWGMTVRPVKDQLTNKVRFQFTMKDFYERTNGKSQWFNLSNLRWLIWKDERTAERERLVQQFRFKGTLQQIVTPKECEQTLQIASNDVPKLKVQGIRKKRTEHPIDLARILVRVRRKNQHQAEQMQNRERSASLEFRREYLKYRRQIDLINDERPSSDKDESPIFKSIEQTVPNDENPNHAHKDRNNNKLHKEHSFEHTSVKPKVSHHNGHSYDTDGPTL